MSHIVSYPFSGGYVSTGTNGRDASEIATGELVTMKGAYYRKNDPQQAWRMPGRSLFGVAGSGTVKGLAICQFDEGGTDKLLASISTKIVAATPGVSGTFADLVTGLNASATKFTACHQDDRWYLGNGYDQNRCLKPDGTVRIMGMATPQIKLTASTSSAAGIVAYPTTDTGGFTNPTFAYDASASDTYASGTLSAAGTVTHTWDGFAADATAGRGLYVRFSLAGLPLGGDSGGLGGSGTVGTGGVVNSGYNVTILLEASQDGGSNWTTIYNAIRTSASPYYSSSWGITANSSLLKVRATLTYNSGTNAATFRVFNIKTQYGSAVAPFSTTGTMYYTYTEYDALDDNESPPVETVGVAAFTNKRYVTLTRSAAVNASATQWRIYRSVPGAADTIDSLGLLATVPISDTVYYDTFNQDGTAFQDPTIQSTPLIPAVTVGDLSIPRDTQPPAFISMISWKGSVCGISRTDRRTFRYSDAGRAESFPEFYVVSSFPIDEHDGLVGQMAVGETLVLLMEGAVLALDDIPRVVDGQFNGANARPIKGHPGCVGDNAYTTFSVAGEPRGAWVSPFGVYITNGQICACVSTDLAWEYEVNVPYLASSVLKWDAKNQILWFEFDSDGDGKNDREMPFHMAEIHAKSESRPKLGQPTPKATSCMASALISSAHYRFSGHPTDGSVYIEESGAEDAATGDNVATELRTGKLGGNKTDQFVVKATLNHTDFGSGQTASVVATIYREVTNSQNSRDQTVRIDGNRGTTFGVARAGEYCDFEVSYDGSGLGAFGGLDIEVEGQGRTGSAGRWASVSATP